MFGLGREAPALVPGNDWSQKKGLPPGRKQTVKDAVPKQVTKIPKILVEAIKHSGEAAIINIISNAVNNDHATVQPT